MTWLYLLLAIMAEVIATSALKATEGFTRVTPSLVAVAFYGIAFFLLAQTLRAMPIGIAYAVWAGLGIVLISVVGWLWYGQALDAPAVVGVGLIVAGVVVVNLFSSSVAH